MQGGNQKKLLQSKVAPMYYQNIPAFNKNYGTKEQESVTHTRGEKAINRNCH